MTSIQNIRKEIKAQNLHVQDVCEWLEKYGSDQDPIIYMGKEMEARDLAYKLPPVTPALDVRFSFYGTLRNGGTGLRRNSNFAHMIKDRIDLFEAQEKEVDKQRKKKKIEYVVTWQEWLGVEAWGANLYELGHIFRKKSFTTRPEAKAYFVRMKKKYDRVQFKKITSDLLGESE